MSSKQHYLIYTNSKAGTLKKEFQHANDSKPSLLNGQLISWSDMRIYLGGHLPYYHPDKKPWLEVDEDGPIQLSKVLEDAGIPRGEVHLVAINGSIVDLEDATVTAADQIKVFSAVGGG
jgi:sulfur carrier protein ThiS